LCHQKPQHDQWRVNAVVVFYPGLGLGLGEKLGWQQFLELRSHPEKRSARSDWTESEYRKRRRSSGESCPEIRVPLELSDVKFFTG
jgi:hypothetical protein